MPLKCKYSRAQIRAAIEAQSNPVGALISDLVEPSKDEKLVRNVGALLLKIFNLSVEGKRLTKSQACRLIPATQAATCIRYVNKVEQLGLVSFEDDKVDRRKTYVVPTEKLILMIEQKVETILDEMRTVLGSVAIESAIPEDNLPLAGVALS